MHRWGAGSYSRGTRNRHTQSVAAGDRGDKPSPRKMYGFSVPRDARIHKPTPEVGFFGAPSMGALLRVQVPPQVDQDERSEAQLREGDRAWEGSVERKS